jgi:alkylation response protein AidB-like acyl-CoA dehydrogenase
VLAPTLTFDAEHGALRVRLREWLARNEAPVPPADFDARVRALSDWQRRLHEAGFIGLSWPVEHGGAGMSIAAEAVLAEELARCAMPELINRIALYTVGPAIQRWGTAEQARWFLPGMRDAAQLWCQGFSEPGAGSDLAAVRTRAVPSGDDLVVTGQKVWTSRALWAHWCALLVRTSGEPGDHKGLTLLALDMSAPGVTVRPLYQILHEPHFSEVFLDDVRVPAANVIGAVGDGWRVAMSTMEYERGLFVLERQIGLRRGLDRLAGELRARGVEAVRVLGELRSGLEALRAQTYRTLADLAAGTARPGGSSVDKLLLTECYQDLCAAGYDLIGEGWTHDLLESRSVSIYSGTTEVQRNVIARRLLDLPRGW